MNANCHPSRVKRVLTGVATLLADLNKRHGEKIHDGFRLGFVAGVSVGNVDVLGSIGIEVDCVCIKAPFDIVIGIKQERRHYASIDR
jgi:hypothetical protein